MSLLLVQHVSNQATGGSPLPAAPVAGHLLVHSGTWRNGTSVGPPTGFTQRKVQGSVNGDGCMISEKISDGTETGNIICTGTIANTTNCVYEFSHPAASGSEYDTSNGSSPTSSTTHQPNSITPASVEEVFIVVLGHGAGTHNPYSIDSGFTLLDDTTIFTKAAHGYKIQTGGIAAENPAITITGASTAILAMATFKPLVQTGKLKRLLSAVWASKPVKTSAGTTKPLKYFNGSVWQKTQ